MQRVQADFSAECKHKSATAARTRKRGQSRTLYDEAAQYVPDVVVHLDPDLARRAALTVALRAVDAREGAQLLDMLGILDVLRSAPDVDTGRDRPTDASTGLASC